MMYMRKLGILLTILIVSLQKQKFLIISDDNAIVISPLNYDQQKQMSLQIIVPGAKVPPETYIATAEATQKYAESTNLYVAIIKCFINLCNPLGNLNAQILKAIQDIKAQEPSLTNANVFISGHSLGGVGAANYYYNNLDQQYAGLVILGSQNLGNHTDFLGNLGFPQDLNDFPGSFLGVVGELDMLSVSHITHMVQQWNNMPNELQAQRVAISLPGLDHSDFCPGYHVPGDIRSESDPQIATDIIGQVIANWITLQIQAPNQTKKDAFAFLQTIIITSTLPMLTPFIKASYYEKSEVCTYAQLIIANLDLENQNKIKIGEMLQPDSPANCEHSHTKYTTSEDKQNIELTDSSFPFYDDDKLKYLQYFIGAKDITCKMVSGERIAAELGVQQVSQNTCRDVNKRSYDIALNLYKENWRSGYDRYIKDGLPLSFLEDYSVTIGPEFVFLSELKIDMNKGTVTSPQLFSHLNSRFYPGNFYCKVISPATIIEWMMTYSISKNNRY